MKQKRSLRSSFVLASALALAAAPGAHATMVTYSFTGHTLGSVQQGFVHHYDTDHINGTVTDYSSFYVEHSDSVSSSSLSFTVDGTRYTDMAPSTGDTRSGWSKRASPPWLSSTSTFTGTAFSDTLISGGSVLSFLAASAGSSGSGFVRLEDFESYNDTVTYDTLGILISKHESWAANFVGIYGDITLGLVDGQELPTGIVPSFGSIHHYWFANDYRYDYDANGNLIATHNTETFKISSAPIASARISGIDASVPEPASLALLGLGLLGMAGLRRRA